MIVQEKARCGGHRYAVGSQRRSPGWPPVPDCSVLQKRSPDGEEAEELIAYVGDRVPLMVHRTTLPAALRAGKQWLETGASAKSCTRAWWYAAEHDRSQRSAAISAQSPALSQGLQALLIFEVLIHNLDALRALLGHSKCRDPDRQGQQELAGEDVAVILMRDARAWRGAGWQHLGAGYGPLPVDRLEIWGAGHADI